MLALLDRVEQRLGQLVAGLGIDLAGLLVDHVVGEEAAEQVLLADLDLLQALSASLRAPRALSFSPASATTLPRLGIDHGRG